MVFILAPAKKKKKVFAYFKNVPYVNSAIQISMAIDLDPGINYPGPTLGKNVIKFQSA